ncbi:NUDIX hydrolase [Reichenbachiella ulvae]|uniref:NUDIX hydrolase n=1 Tax=Reichenbachiella ulvae TaxID=2980104 RepID=A0ABT3CNF4_9BACT|nr:NUDIX hydrolase [Reichenbachiella ulvae]MCV9385117.1 NUDIX hydrolase [Reichenbachiella ulvae]
MNKKEEVAIQVEDLQPGLSIDCVIFGFHENELKVLLLRLKNSDIWALPGGFVNKEIDVDQEAIHVLKNRTGLESIFLHQFHLFGSVSRNNTYHTNHLIEQKLLDPNLKEWFAQRFVTVGYYALVEYSKVEEPTPDLLSEACEWCAINDLPNLMLDHKDIILEAHATLKKELNHQPIGLNLLPEKFTIPELQSLYETVLEKKLDRRNFRRKMLGYDILIQTNEKRTGVAHKAPDLYKFDQEKYHLAISQGFKSGW